MGRNVWACIVACSAIMAQVGEIINGFFTKFFSPVHRRERGAVSFAVSTGEAYLELSLCFSVIHLVASSPAILPKTVPMVNPKPPKYPRDRIFPDMISPAAYRFFKGVPSLLITRAL